MKYVAYYRVSTDKQEKSGLGLKAQVRDIAEFAELNGGAVIADFTEAETATNKKYRPGINEYRPELDAAIALCKAESATLLISRVDRLFRDEELFFRLRREFEKSDLKRIFVDNPYADEATLGQQVVRAAEEARKISESTKKGIAQSPNRENWGTPENLTHEGQLKGAQTRKIMAIKNKNNERATAYILSLKEVGNTFAVIADKLNENSYRSSNGYKFHPSTARALYVRAVA